MENFDSQVQTLNEQEQAQRIKEDLRIMKLASDVVFKAFQGYVNNKPYTGKWYKLARAHECDVYELGYLLRFLDSKRVLNCGQYSFVGDVKANETETRWMVEVWDNVDPQRRLLEVQAEMLVEMRKVSRRIALYKKHFYNKPHFGVPDWLIKIKKISWFTKSLLCWLMEEGILKDRTVFRRNDVAKKLFMSERTLYRAMNKLKDLGFISLESSNNHATYRKITLNWEKLEALPQ